jgi:speckle-type POZ protein
MFFNAIFDQPSNGKANQIEIEDVDVDPEVFQEILRYIYTGRLSETAAKMMPFEMLAVAEKFSLYHLKNKCLYLLTLQMLSTRHSMQILLLADKTHPAFRMRKYVLFDFYVSIRSKVSLKDNERRLGKGRKRPSGKDFEPTARAIPNLSN